jgi:protein-S-isoprenylcysteine O-methyltransferase Ste14
MTKRMLFFAYGLASYAFFLVTFLYLVGFLANVPLLPKTIDSGEPAALGLGLLVNTLVILAFGLHHSVFARPTFKRWWTQYVPQPIERTTYVLVSTILLVALLALWQPLPTTVWSIANPLGQGFVWAIFAIGWGLILYATFLIDHFELFGLRQVVLFLLGRADARETFVTPMLYRLIRHPLMLGWLTVFWATPTMSVGHLLFTLLMSGYIFIGILLEERTLAAVHGLPYIAWKQRTPMLVPGLRFRQRKNEEREAIVT